MPEPAGGDASVGVPDGPAARSVQIAKEGDFTVATGAVSYSSKFAADVFQRASDALVSGGGTISVGPGVYMFAESVGLSSPNVLIEGSGDDTVIDTRVERGVLGSAFYFVADHVEIRRLKITGADSSPSPSVDSPRLVTVQNLEGDIRDLTIDDVTFDTLPDGNSSFVVLRSAQLNVIGEVAIKNSRFIANRTYPEGGPGARAYILVGAKARSVTIENNEIVGEGQKTAPGVDLWQCEDDIRIVGNRIKDVSIGVAMTTTHDGTYVSDLREVYVAGNFIQNTFYDNVWVSSGRNISVVNNCLTQPGRNGIWVGRRLDYFPTYVTLTNNSIAPNEVDGAIYVSTMSAPTTTQSGNNSNPCP
jgi:hypothetical protein